VVHAHSVFSHSPLETLIAAAERHSLKARFTADWEDLNHLQSTIRVTLA